MGIFIESSDEKQHPLTQLDRNQPVIDVLFSEYINSDTSLRTAALDEALAQKYNEKHLLFFGYANKELERVVNKGVNVDNFIRICLSIADDDKQKNIDIIAPIREDQFIELGLNYKSYSQVTFVCSKNNLVHHNVIYTNPFLPERPQLRVINLLRFDGNTFKKLVAASHPFKLCTGDQSLSDENGYTLLHHATHHGHSEMVRYLINNGADVNITTPAPTGVQQDIKHPKMTALDIALSTQHRDTIAILLLEAEAAISPAVTGQFHAIHLAARNGRLDIIEKLITRDPGLVHIQDTFNQTALLWAASKGHSDVVAFFIAQGVNVNIATQVIDNEKNACYHHNYSPLDWAIEGNHNTTIQILIHAGAKANDSLNMIQKRKLHQSIKDGELNETQILIQNNYALISEIIDDEYTALDLAIFYQQVEIASYLIIEGTGFNLATRLPADHSDREHHNNSHSDWTITRGRGARIEGINDVLVAHGLFSSGQKLKAGTIRACPERVAPPKKNIIYAI